MKRVLQILLFLFISSLYGQDLLLDETFNVVGNGFTINSDIRKVLIQPDGKILIGGAFTSYNGVSRNKILRLNIDGSLDNSFDPGIGPNNTVITMTLDSFGRIYIGGGFTTVNGLSKKAIARLNPDGSLDASFSISFNTSDTQTATVRDVIVSNDKILIAGDFRAVITPQSGVWAIGRFNLDGTYDTSFTPPMNSSSAIHKILVQADGKILIGGFFSFGVTDMGFARLNIDGTKDTAFNSLNTIFGSIYDICFDSNNKILIGGIFASSFGNSQMNILARVNADGLIDDDFQMFEVDSGDSSTNVVNAIKLYNSNILIGGQIPFYQGSPADDLMLLNTVGISIPDFNIGNGFNSEFTTYINSIAIQSDNKIIVAGQFNEFDNEPVYSTARLNPSDLAANCYVDKGIYIYNDQQNLYIKSSNTVKAVSIYDVSGRYLSTLDIVDGVTSISGIPLGQVVLLNILFDNGEVQKLKFFI